MPLKIHCDNVEDLNTFLINQSRLIQLKETPSACRDKNNWLLRDNALLGSKQSRLICENWECDYHLYGSVPPPVKNIYLIDIVYHKLRKIPSVNSSTENFRGMNIEKKFLMTTPRNKFCGPERLKK